MYAARDNTFTHQHITQPHTWTHTLHKHGQKKNLDLCVNPSLCPCLCLCLCLFRRRDTYCLSTCTCGCGATQAQAQAQRHICRKRAHVSQHRNACQKKSDPHSDKSVLAPKGVLEGASLRVLYTYCLQPHTYLANTPTLQPHTHTLQPHTRTLQPRGSSHAASSCFRTWCVCVCVCVYVSLFLYHSLSRSLYVCVLVCVCVCVSQEKEVDIR